MSVRPRFTAVQIEAMTQGQQFLEDLGIAEFLSPEMRGRAMFALGNEEGTPIINSQTGTVTGILQLNPQDPNEIFAFGADGQMISRMPLSDSLLTRVARGAGILSMVSAPGLMLGGAMLARSFASTGNIEQVTPMTDETTQLVIEARAKAAFKRDVIDDPQFTPIGEQFGPRLPVEGEAPLGQPGDPVGMPFKQTGAFRPGEQQFSNQAQANAAAAGTAAEALGSRDPKRRSELIQQLNSQNEAENINKQFNRNDNLLSQMNNERKHILEQPLYDYSQSGSRMRGLQPGNRPIVI